MVGAYGYGDAVGQSLDIQGCRARVLKRADQLDITEGRDVASGNALRISHRQRALASAGGEQRGVERDSELSSCTERGLFSLQNIGIGRTVGFIATAVNLVNALGGNDPVVASTRPDVIVAEATIQQVVTVDPGTRGGALVGVGAVQHPTGVLGSQQHRHRARADVAALKQDDRCAVLVLREQRAVAAVESEHLEHRVRLLVQVYRTERRGTVGTRHRRADVHVRGGIVDKGLRDQHPSLMHTAVKCVAKAKYISSGADGA